jgi:hypothetical protein
VIDESDVQLKKHQNPMDVTELRIVIDESDVQLKKHSTQRMQQNCEL